MPTTQWQPSHKCPCLYAWSCQGVAGPSKQSMLLLQMKPELEAFRLRLREHGVILDGDVGFGGMGCVWR